MYIVYTKIVHH